MEKDLAAGQPAAAQGPGHAGLEDAERRHLEADAGQDGPSDAQRVAAWLLDQPAGVIAWGDDHRLMHPLARSASWVDVFVPDLAAALEWGWVWTVVTPGDDDAGSAWPQAESTTIALAPDCRMFMVYDPKEHWYSDAGPVVVTGLGEQPDPEQQRALDEYALSVGGTVKCVDGWLQETLSASLSAWTAAMTGRSDLLFSFDRDIMSARLRELQAVDLDSVERFDIGDGVSASDQVMDFLLQADPDTAADVVSSIKRLLGRGAARGPDSPGWGA